MNVIPMPKSIVLDASVFISRLIPADPYYELSRDFFAAVQKKKMAVFLPMLTVMEVLHAYFRASGDQKQTDKIYEEIIEWNISKTMHIVNIESSFLIYFTAWHHLFDLKTSDAAVALTAHRLRLPLVTWDKKLLRAAKKHIKAVTPDFFL